MEPRREYEMLLRATHFVGDGLAMHQFGNDFFALLAGRKSDDELQDLLQEEWYTRWHVTPDEVSSFPLHGLAQNLTMLMPSLRRTVSSLRTRRQNVPS